MSTPTLCTELCTWTDTRCECCLLRYDCPFSYRPSRLPQAARDARDAAAASAEQGVTFYVAAQARVERLHTELLEAHAELAATRTRCDEQVTTLLEQGAALREEAARAVGCLAEEQAAAAEAMTVVRRQHQAAMRAAGKEAEAAAAAAAEAAANGP